MNSTPSGTSARILGAESLVRRRATRNTAALGLALVFALWLNIGAGGLTVTTWIDDLGELAAAAAAAAGCAVASRHASGRDRLSWALISASCGMWAAGQLIWSWLELIANAEPFPSLADVGFLTAIPLMIGGLLSFPRLLRGTAARIQAGVDALIIAIALLAISWSTVLGAVYTAGADSAWALALSLVYPASDIAIVTVALVLATRARSTTRAPLLLLAGGVAAIALSDSSLAYATTTNAGLTVGLDWGWFAGFLLIALAGLEATDKSGPAASRTPLPAALRSLFLYVVVVAAVGIVAWHVLQDDGLDAVLFLSLVTLILLTFARQLLAILDSAGLLQELVHDSLTGLPPREMLCSRIDTVLASGSGAGMVLCVDVDNFAAINERFGREAGALVLGVLGRRLDASIHHPDVVAHLDEDRFAALLSSTADLDDAIDVAMRIQRTLEAPVEVHGSIISVETTIGISPTQGVDTAESVIQFAETAALAGQSGGGRALVVFEPIRETTGSTSVPGPMPRGSSPRVPA